MAVIGGNECELIAWIHDDELTTYETSDDDREDAGEEMKNGLLTSNVYIYVENNLRRHSHTSPKERGFTQTQQHDGGDGEELPGVMLPEFDDEGLKPTTACKFVY